MKRYMAASILGLLLSGTAAADGVGSFIGDSNLLGDVPLTDRDVVGLVARHATTDDALLLGSVQASDLDVIGIAGSDTPVDSRLVQSDIPFSDRDVVGYHDWVVPGRMEQLADVRDGS